MNAIKFIQQHGVEKARDVNEQCPQYYHYYHIAQGAYYTCMGIGRVAVKELNQLVESVDIITKVGGIREAIEEHTKWMHAPELHLYRIGESVERLKQAIADYEAIGGEHV